MRDDGTGGATGEKLFFDALRDTFVGEPTEGDSGFVELRRIREHYFDGHVAPRLRAVIREHIADIRGAGDDVLGRLRAFLRECFAETGSIRPRAGCAREDTGGQDTALCWETRGLRYVRTDRPFRSREIEVDGFRFLFDVSRTQHRRSTEKRTLSYAFAGCREDGALVLEVRNTERGERTDVARIRRTIAESFDARDADGRIPSERTLKRAVRMFERERESDWFLDPNARANLRERLEEWLSRELLAATAKEDASDLVERIRRLRALEKIALTAIDLVARFEDELVKIWNKPKFVLGSHYVITLDRIAARDGGTEVLDRLFANPGMERQIREWRELGMVDEDFVPEQVWNRGPGGGLHERYRYLPVDTGHFPDLEPAVLSLFDHLDRELDGWLVHSDNYQALDTMLPKFRERVSCVYIDPPYNTGNDNFPYCDRFRRASWLTMIENRLRLAREWMREDGVIFVSIDDGEQATLRGAMELVFGADGFVNNIIWQKKYAPQNDARWLSDNHDFLVLFAKRKDAWRPGLLPRTAKQDGRYRNPDNDPRGPWKPSDLSVRTYTPEYDYPIDTPSGRTVNPPPGRCWAVPRERMRELVEDGRIWFGPDGNGTPALKRFLSEVKQGITALTIWPYEEVGHNQEGKQELKRMFADPGTLFGTPKPTRLLQRVIRIGAGESKEALILDFFAGSGTTGHAIVNMNREDGGRRRYVLVEMAEYFHTVLLPRIKKVIFSDRWRDGRAQRDGKGVGHFVKYFRVEQYEDALRRLEYRDHGGSTARPAGYPFPADPETAGPAVADVKAGATDAAAAERLPDLAALYPDIDVAETLSCLTGKWIRRVRPAPDDPGVPGEVEFEDGTTVDLRRPPRKLTEPLVRP